MHSFAERPTVDTSEATVCLYTSDKLAQFFYLCEYTVYIYIYV